MSHEELKGSARSVPSINIRDILAEIDKDYPGIIKKFGGHAMAAGLSIGAESFDTFQKAYVYTMSKYLSLSECEGEILSDGGLTEEDLTLELVLLLQQAGPWGQQFPEPVFDNIFEVLDQRIVGQHHLKLTLQFNEGKRPIEGILFNVDTKVWPNHRLRYIHAAYKINSNTYKGRTKLELQVLAVLPHNVLESPSSIGARHDQVVTHE